MIKAVLFDMDGVLIDARDWHYEALNQALGYFGVSIDRFDHVVTYDGHPTRKKLEYLSRDKNLPRGLHELIHQMKQRFTVENIILKCRPTYQHQYMLQRLRADKIRLTVCSNSIRSTIELMLRQAAIDSFFEFTLSCEDVVESKPDPRIYQTAIQRLGLQPQECLIVEDNPQGIEAAQRSGGHVLEVRSPVDVHYDAVMGRIREINQAVRS